MQLTEIASLAAAAAAAGVVNAIAGGGTLLTFPTLLLFVPEARVANATSTVALMLGTAGGLFGYRKQLDAVKPWLARFVPVSILGGWLGSVLLTRTDDEVFRKLIPFLLLFATVLFLAQGAFRRFAGLADQGGEVHPQHHTVWAAVFFQFGVALYGGYFGAGIGILMLASLGFIGLTNIHEMNALKTLLSALINLVASAWFVWSGLVDWPRAAVMTAGAVAGYYLGAHFSQRIPQTGVRRIITAVGFSISAVMFYRQFLAGR
ncbi:MAG: sulfite exporter TauE/SafE family protein [Verrucomicrobia bacterium]|nr:sulfite exporter TauE/SafE family protein [Verrucomicrobiota bacterium]